MMFSTSDLTNMRTAQTNHMMDLCVFQACVETADSFNELVQTWPVDGSDLTCGLDMRPGAERHGIDKTVLEYDATIRLPIASTPSVRDRVKITKRFGEVLDFDEAVTNLVEQTVFGAADISKWAPGGGNGIARSTDQKKFGTRSLKCTYQDNPYLTYYTITLTAAAYTFGVWVYIPSDYDGTEITAVFTSFDGATGLVRDSADMTKTDQWQFIAAHATPVGGDLAGFLVISVSTNVPTAGKFIYIDGVDCYQKAYPLSHCDGDLGPGYSWNGVPHDSTSKRLGTELIYDIVGPIQRGPSGVRLLLKRVET